MNQKVRDHVNQILLDYKKYDSDTIKLFEIVKTLAAYLDKANNEIEGLKKSLTIKSN